MALGHGFGATLPFVTFFCSGRTGPLNGQSLNAGGAPHVGGIGADLRHCS